MREDLKPAKLQHKATMEAVKGRGRPLGGAPEVSIPPLDAEPVVSSDGRKMSMHEQAELLKDPSNPLSPYYDPKQALGAKVGPGAAQMDPHALRQARQAPAEARRAPAGPFGGTLSQEQLQDPRARQGVGAAYMANQPALSQRQEAKRALSEETVEGLEALSEFHKKAQAEQEKQQAEADEKRAERDAQVLDEELDQLNQPSFMNQYQREVNELNTPELKKATEDRCKPLDVEQLILDGEVRQEVPIVSGKLVVTFRTITGEENLEIERMVFGSNEPDIYVFDKLSMMQLACGLYAVNNQVLPSHLDDSRRFDKSRFKHKFGKVLAMPLVMLASMGINFTWFDLRTRSLFVDLGPLKNG